MMSIRSITSLQHPLVKHLVKLRTDNSYRQEQHTLVLEGVKPVQEVSHAIIKLFYTPAYASFAETLGGEKWQITEDVLRKISGMSSPEGFIAEVKMPPFVALEGACQVLGLDGMSDPGNVGTLLRTALALGWDTVYFLPGSCDPFNEKALRAARGAHFKLKLAKGSAETLEQWVKAEKGQALVAELKGVDPETITRGSKCVLVLGNEAHGASEKVQQFCTSVTIPMPGEMESLNVAVAGGILLYLLSHSRRERT
jgi:TrmH family RNA methyltransferase